MTSLSMPPDAARRALLATLVPVALSLLSLFPREAQAGWTALPLWTDSLRATVSSARACKTLVNGPFGAVWRINYQVFRRDDRVENITVYSIRYSNAPATLVNAQTNHQWLNGVVSGTGDGVFASVFFDDRFGFQVRFARPVWDAEFGMWFDGASLGERTPAQIANC